MGLRNEIIRTEAQVKHLCSVKATDTVHEDESEEETDKRRRGTGHEADDCEEWGEAWDDVSGAHLDPREVRKARMKEKVMCMKRKSGQR